MMATAQVPASSSTSTASSTGGQIVSLRTNLSEKNVMGGHSILGTEPTMIGKPSEVAMNSRVANNNIGVGNGGHSQQLMDFRGLNTLGKNEGHSNSKTSKCMLCSSFGFRLLNTVNYFSPTFEAIK